MQIWLRLKRPETSGRFSFHHPQELLGHAGFDLPHGIEYVVGHDRTKEVYTLSSEWVRRILPESANHAVVVPQSGKNVGNVLKSGLDFENGEASAGAHAPKGEFLARVLLVWLPTCAEFAILWNFATKKQVGFKSEFRPILLKSPSQAEVPDHNGNATAVLVEHVHKVNRALWLPASRSRAIKNIFTRVKLVSTLGLGDAATHPAGLR